VVAELAGDAAAELDEPSFRAQPRCFTWLVIGGTMVLCAQNASSAVVEFSPRGLIARQPAWRSATPDCDLVVRYERPELSEVVAP
jgi:hypothetical protein